MEKLKAKIIFLLMMDYNNDEFSIYQLLREELKILHLIDRYS